MITIIAVATILAVLMLEIRRRIKDLMDNQGVLNSQLENVTENQMLLSNNQKEIGNAIEGLGSRIECLLSKD